MTLALQQTELYQQLNNPNNPAFEYLSDERLQRDAWDIRQDLPPLAEEALIRSRKTIKFESISLLWLRDLTKLATIIAVGNRRWSLIRLLNILSQTKDFDSWLVRQGYITPSILTVQIVQQWGQNKSDGQRNCIYGLFGMLRQLDCIHFHLCCRRSQYPKYPKTIPEKVKQRLDLALEDLDKPIYLAIKLHAALGTRSIEIAKIPLDCLRLREEVYRVRIPTGKQDDSEQEQDLPEELVPLVQQQQAFLREKFGEDFPWLFPNWRWLPEGIGTMSCPPRFRYYKEQLKSATPKINNLLKWLIKEHDIRTCDGELAQVTSHMFRRTWATVADRMGKRPDQIMHGLRHLNLDMQDSYANIPPQEQEKRTERVLVDNSGRHTAYRTDRDSEFLRKEWRVRQVELGVCTRPSIQVDCEFEYICLGCEFARYAVEHLPRLLEVREENQQLLKRCIELGQSDSRRAHSGRQFISRLNPIIASLQAEVNQEQA